MFCKFTPILNTIESLLNNVHSRFAQLDWPDLTSGELRAVTVLAAFWLLFALEARYAFRRVAPRTSRQSYFTNLGSLVLNDTLMSLLSVSSLWLIAERYADHGLLSAITHPALKALLAFVLLDLVLYLWHRANHRFEWLWTYHKIHHSDRAMNVSTAFRLHGVEVFLTAVIKAIFILVMGIDATVLLANEAIVTLCVMFHHANITFPGERWLGRLIVVPRIHRAHHSTRRAEHDNNYGAVFSFWDRVLGTFADLEPRALGLQQVPGYGLLGLIRYGLPHVSGYGLLALIRYSLPQLPRRPALKPETVQAMIAEAAYFRAEKRGFAPGNDFIDWVEAEREILTKTGAVRRPPRRLVDWHGLNPLALFRGHGTMSSC